MKKFRSKASILLVLVLVLSTFSLAFADSSKPLYDAGNKQFLSIEEALEGLFGKMVEYDDLFKLEEDSETYKNVKEMNDALVNAIIDYAEENDMEIEDVLAAIEEDDDEVIMGLVPKVEEKQSEVESKTLEELGAV